MAKFYFNRLLFVLTAAIPVLFSNNSFSQKIVKKYPSLLWEITGNGLKKPSYLFGTMHVSSKMVFHLPDSFYHAIKNVETVALELNPDVWQGQMVKLDQLQLNYKNFSQAPSADYLNETSFQLDKYEDELKAALSTEPTVLNGLLYRSYKSKEDFEEDTFLDLYIFQTGKKLGKRATGVENYYETEKIVLEAYSDMAKEKGRKTIDTDGESMMGITRKMEDAYRAGDLDLLDSLSDMMDASEAFRNKFLYKRNEIQANSIDTILQKNSLFVGVGAAHLAGDKGVIEMLRRKGYTLRPIIMSARRSFEKDRVDKLKVPVKFITNSAEDEFYKVDVPGPLYKMASDVSGLDRRQYADMSNGAYYLLTRIKTHAAFVGNTEQQVLKKVDSLLYENIPGKIIKKAAIKKNNYNGYDITNRTRRGDIQRYQIFVTPFEVLVFKMSGKENYVEGAEAERFFSSIQLKEPVTGWINFEPAQGGFKVKLPQQPHQFLNTSTADNVDRWEYEAIDKNTGNAFLILKNSVNNFRFLEEDTSDLGLIEESFKLSEFIKEQKQRNISSFNGYPAMDVRSVLKDGRTIKAKFIIKGSHYYLLAAAAKTAGNDIDDFFSTFQFTSFKYPHGQYFVDTFLNYTVTTPIIPELEENLRALIEKMGNDPGYRFGFSAVDTYWPKAKNALFKSDSTGEIIAVAMQQYPKYYYIKDSSAFWKDEINDYLKRTDFILAKKEAVTIDGLRGYNLILKDTNSSRQINRLLLLKNDRLYRVVSIGDTLNHQSDFVKNFYATFRPLNNSSDRNIFANTIDVFLNDFFSADSATHAKAQSSISNIYYAKSDIPKILNAINRLKYGDKDYRDSKSRLIAELAYITDSTATPQIINALKEMYFKTADTSTFQNAVYKGLAKKKTKGSYALLKELLLQDPPVFVNNYEYNTFFNDINDSLALARNLFPEILQLSTITEFKDNINSLLVTLVDSNFITSKEYENYFTKIYFDAKLELKKQQSKDEKILDLESNDNIEPRIFTGYNNTKSKLDDYAVLLMPFYDKPTVKSFFYKILYSKDPALQLSTAVLMLRNNKFVPDSILINLAAKNEYRGKLFKLLENAKLLNKFPKQYKSQADIAKSFLSSNKLDSVVYLSGRLITFRNTKGHVYFFKYRAKKDDAWKIGISGLQPGNSNEAGSDDKLVKLTDRKLREDEPLNDQLDKQLKRLLFSLSKSGRNFYQGDTYNRFRRDEY
ncbi:MAG TPA: TraB/GumN family protein [Chitinophagaceae bacterium]|nr:TraB/GumN family protein [Chitinophagaceae bacterium]